MDSAQSKRNFFQLHVNTIIQTYDNYVIALENSYSDLFFNNASSKIKVDNSPFKIPTGMSYIIAKMSLSKRTFFGTSELSMFLYKSLKEKFEHVKVLELNDSLIISSDTDKLSAFRKAVISLEKKI